MYMLRRRFVVLAFAIPLVLSMAGPAAAGGNLGRVTTTPTSVNFGRVPVGSPSEDRAIWFTNGTKVPLYVVDYANGYGGEFQYEAYDLSQNCATFLDNNEPLQPGQTCGFVVYFLPEDTGASSAKFVLELTNFINTYTPSVTLRGSGV